MVIKKKLIFILLIALVSSIIFWQILDLTTRLTPELDDHRSNLEKYYQMYENTTSINLELLTSTGAIGKFDGSIFTKEYFQKKIDIGYIFLNYLSNILGLTFENFLFIVIFLTYLVYIRIFYSLTSCKYLMIYLLLILFASFWMNSTVGAVLRQAIAIGILYYYLFFNNKISYMKSFLILALSSSIHMSAIILLPYLIFEKIFIKNLKLLSLFFVIVTIVYIFELNVFVRDVVSYFADTINFETRALMGDKPDHPSVGFTIGKLLATIIPPIIYLLTIFLKNNPIKMIERRFYAYYIYVSSLGMLLSQMTYYERVLMYAWALSPCLLAFFFNSIYRSFIILLNKNLKSIR